MAIKNTTKTTSKFIEEAKAKFGEKFDYSKVNYINGNTKVTIICPIHGEFQQKPHVHIHKVRDEKGNHGCPECGKIVRDRNHTMTTQEFIEKAKAKYGEKFDYSKTKYVNWETTVTIICPIHDEFEILANCHIRKRGYGCQKCSKIEGNKKITLTTQEFIEKAIQNHGDKYDYSKVNYISARILVTIICPIHGEFQQKPCVHNMGSGCPCCGGRRKREFI